MNEMRIMDIIEGDIKIEWDEDSKDEVTAAEKAFNAAKKKGMLFFKQKKDGSAGRQIYSFDPEIERIVGVPALRGG